MKILRYEVQHHQRAKGTPPRWPEGTPRTVEELASDELRKLKLYKQYCRSLFVFISSKIDRREDAEEILQDTWMSIFDSLPMFNHKSSFLTWACAIAFHEVADFYRKRKIKSLVFSHLPFLENLVSQALGPEMVCQQKEIKREVEKVFASLSEGYRQILRLKYIEGFTVAQIGKILRLSFKSTESRLFRARLAFQKSWNENYLKSPFGFSSFLASKRGI